MTNRSGTRALTPAEQQLLSQPLTLPFSGKVIKNRFLKAALSESLARPDGQIDKSHTNNLVNLYEAWAKGGSGLILTGNIMVDRLHREMERNVAVEDERDIGRLKLWAEAVHKHAPPRALTEQEIKSLVQSFTTTAVVLSNAGFDGIELHAAHGYLISQFLNPRTNIRTDSYGGSLENRARFLSEIVQSIRAATPASFIVGVKLNSVDFGRRRGDNNNKDEASSQEGDNGVDKDLEEAVQVSVMLENLGVDFIEISGGSYESFAAGLLDGKGVPNTDPASDPTRSARSRQREAHFAVFADKISSALTKTKVVLTGGFLSAVAMADAVKGENEEGAETTAMVADGGKPHIDMVGLGRTICQEPDLPNLVMTGSVTGALTMPKTPGGFMDIVFLCGGNLHRLATKKTPVTSLGGMLFSPAHYGFGFDYTKVGVHKIKTLVGC
ncbi:hypothetical protein BG006_005944 [Podila minutissima]|uniref:NADH:flavin oxidoreductase/NADH oxidase N-terminal domain-containing protein n=1 Tax=Podila minutissima TaxID=64525 RepID=A0A9P5SJQ8_9FUNG|nr:hypothetical protein BG006_005944 [Podila minutissima]